MDSYTTGQINHRQNRGDAVLNDMKHVDLFSGLVIKAIVDADEGGIMDTYPDKSLEQEFDDAERAAIARADERLDDEKNRMPESQTTGDWK